MMLNDTKIRELGLVSKGADLNYRSASYDLAVDSVITPAGEVVAEYLLPPQGMVKVISAEAITLPDNITGCVHVKTSLCNEGVLALNIGIVDPGFSGPLQSTLLNFGKNSYRIRRGSIFGRITFHQQMPSPSFKVLTKTMEQVKEDARDHVHMYLAKDFLNFAKTVEGAAKEASDGYRSTLLWFVPGLALVLTMFTWFLNFSNATRVEGYFNIKDRANEVTRNDQLELRMTELWLERDQLQQELNQMKEEVKQMRDVQQEGSVGPKSKTR